MAAARPTPPLRLRVRVHPRAAHDRIAGYHGDAVKLHVHAPPVDGAANAAVVRLLADTLGVPRRTVRVVQGASSRNKVVEVDAPDPTACAQRLTAAITARVDKPGDGD